MIKNIVILFSCLLLTNCLSYNKPRPKIIVDVIIENNTSETLYTEKLSGYFLAYGDNEKIYMLVDSIDIDTSKITVDCFRSLYIYDVVIPPNNKGRYLSISN